MPRLKHLFGIVLLFALTPVFAEENTHFIEVSHCPFSIPQTMTVFVKDHEGKPLPDAEIVLQGTDGSFLLGAKYTHLRLEGKTDHEGKAVLRLPDEWFEGKVTHVWLNASTPRYTQQRSGVWYEGRHPRPDTIIVVPEEVTIEFDGDLIAIRLLDEDGQPVEGVRLLPDSSVTASQIFDVPLPQASDAQGILMYGPLTGQQLDHGRLSIRFWHPDFQNEWLALTRTESLGEPQTVTLRRGSEIFGTITDEQGRPLAGATLFAAGENRLSERKAVTDAEGRYRLNGLYPSDQILIIHHEGKRLHVQTLNRSDLGKACDITLQKALPFRVKVVTEDGQPLHGVKVEPLFTLDLGKFDYQYHRENILLRSGVPITDKTHFTDENGIWEWPNIPAGVDGEIELRFHPLRAVPQPPKEMAYAVSPRDRHFAPREEPHIVTATLTKDVYSLMRVDFTTWKDSKKLKVRVVDENRKPLAGALVEPRSGYGDSFGHNIRVDSPFPTNENGVVCFDFSRTDVSDIDDFWVNVSAEGYRPVEYYRTIGIVTTAHSRTSYKTLPDEVEIVLSPEGKQVGFVRDEDGNPVEGATVTFERPKTEPVLTDENGKWSVDVPPGFPPNDNNTQVSVQKEGYLRSMTPLQFAKDSTLRTAKPVSFRVVDGDGNPISGVQVMFVQGSVQTENPSLWRTDAKGEFHGTVAVGGTDKAAFLLKKDGWTSQWQEMDLAGETENLQCVLKPGKDLRVRFSFEGEEKLPEIARVFAHIRVPSIERSANHQANNWNEASRDENGVMLLKDAPDCEATYYFTVPGPTRTSSSVGYGETIARDDGVEVVHVVKTRSPNDENLKKTTDNDYGRTTPYGLIHYHALGKN